MIKASNSGLHKGRKSVREEINEDEIKHVPYAYLI